MSETHEVARAPWTAEQVAALNAWQGLGHVHPYTCGMCRALLVATTDGWECPECGYRQDWAHAFSADVCRHPGDPLRAFRQLQTGTGAMGREEWRDGAPVCPDHRRPKEFYGNVGPVDHEGGAGEVWRCSACEEERLGKEIVALRAEVDRARREAGADSRLIADAALAFEIAALRQQLAEKDAALAAAGKALRAIADADPGMFKLPDRSKGALSVRRQLATTAKGALSAPALARAIELDRARREVCVIAAEHYSAACSPTFDGLITVGPRLRDALTRLRALSSPEESR